jgi:hypothetical protein
VNATTASSPTIWIAPAAWCTCMRACLSGDGSFGASLNVLSESSPRESAWSISPCTQDSGPRSKSAAVSVATMWIGYRSSIPAGNCKKRADR